MKTEEFPDFFQNWLPKIFSSRFVQTLIVLSLSCSYFAWSFTIFPEHPIGFEFHAAYSSGIWTISTTRVHTHVTTIQITL